MCVRKGARPRAFHGGALVHGVSDINGLFVNGELAKQHSVFVLQLVANRVPDTRRGEAGLSVREIPSETVQHDDAALRKTCHSHCQGVLGVGERAEKNPEVLL